MRTRTYLLVTGILFAIIAVVHLLRLLQGWPAQIDGWSVPMMVSVMAVLVSGLIAAWGLTLAKRI